MLYKKPDKNIKLLKDFTNYLVLQNVRSKNYFWQLKKFLDQVDLKTVSQEVIDNYLVDVRQNLSAGTYNNSIKALKQFFKFMKLEYELPKMHKTTKDRRAIKSIDEKTLAQILDACDWVDFQNPLQAKAILLLMYYTGLRKSEVSILQRKDINLKARTMNVYLKKVDTYKEFLLPDRVIAAIKDYYMSSEGEIKNAFNIGVGGISYIFNKLKPCFPNEGLHPHLFKKSAITWLAQFYSIDEISLLVGISPLTIRDHYLNVSYEKIKENFWEVTGEKKKETKEIDKLKQIIKKLEERLMVKK